MYIQFIDNVLHVDVTEDRIVSLTHYPRSKTIIVTFHSITDEDVHKLRLAFGAEDERRREQKLKA